MIAAVALLLADAPTLAALPPQALPERGCAAYLFTAGDTRTFVAMVSGDGLRLMIDGASRDLARVEASGDGGFGLAATTSYRGTGVGATLELATASRADLTDGGVVSAATLRIDREGGDGLAVPLVGLVGCAPGAAPQPSIRSR